MERHDTTDDQAEQCTGMSVALGAGIGMTLGVLIGGWAVPVGIGAGAGVGVALGAAFDGRHPRTSG